MILPGVNRKPANPNARLRRARPGAARAKVEGSGMTAPSLSEKLVMVPAEAAGRTGTPPA